MNIQSQPVMTTEEFLRWNEGREGKRELVHGRVFEMMINVTRGHVKLAGKLTAILINALDESEFDIGTADFGVRTPAGVRYPDVFVDRSGGTASDLAAIEPLFVAEILSPSSLAIDFGEKAEEYTTIESLRHYLVLSQDEPRIWLWSRDEDGVFQRPQMIEGPDSEIPLTGFDLNIKLADLYRGIA
ncbi:hypothetical protein FP2506_03785 [Fulvimarina pelagi HTCC2506]|uniref:Putative restriction endonuclease domain-containing protein n=2 Tax=Fulvimarina pelagi TaxID=217511 RepID=Q0FZG1_9HYPH|nr:Uma2 family endonuclease [Fulvimarina pelagi]EAU40317.1 hypothetical protein FP2506_03785 [Fulvimarina pelagi HTCC2506]BAT31354.1 hypothetical protein [Fulvimarina pelagi]